MKLSIVLVTYGADKTSLISNLKLIIPAPVLYDLVIVDTKNNTVNNFFVHDFNLNSHFEFSGYAYGVYCVGKKNTSEVNCIVLNDSVFESHSRIHIKEYVRRLIACGQSDETISGVISTFMGIKYISTYLFGIKSKKLSLEVWVNIFTSKNFKKYFPADYDDQVGDWLQPSNFLSGWHKSIPGEKLSLEEFDRKKEAILIEHCLLENLKRENIEAHQIKSLRLTITSFMDRVFVNFLKIKIRLANKFTK